MGARLISQRKLLPISLTIVLPPSCLFSALAINQEGAKEEENGGHSPMSNGRVSEPNDAIHSGLKDHW